jgi:hypothetical protein
MAGTVLTNGYLNYVRNWYQSIWKYINRTYETRIMYQNTIKEGDHLLNWLKKFARVMDF